MSVRLKPLAEGLGQPGGAGGRPPGRSLADVVGGVGGRQPGRSLADVVGAGGRPRRSLADVVAYLVNRGVVESFAEFSKVTTAHGVKFFFQGKKVSRVCFFVVWLAAVIYTCWTCWRGIADYRSHPTGTKFEIVRSDEINISFPTISLCNINKIRKDYMDENTQLKEIYDLVYELETPDITEDIATERGRIIEHLKSFRGSPLINTTIDQIYREGGPLDSDLLTCKIGLRDCSEFLGQEIFERVVSFQGNCFKLNPRGLLNASIAGNLGGLSVFLHAQHNQYSHVRLTEPSEGFKISFHDNEAEGNVGNTGFVVSPGLQYFIQLGYKQTRLLHAPYGEGACISNSDYRPSTCIHSCIQTHILDSCGCVPFQKYLDHRTASSGKGKYINNLQKSLQQLENITRLCTLKDAFTCVISKRAEIIRETIRHKKFCTCPKACQFSVYDHSISSSLLSNKFIERLLLLYKKRNDKQTDSDTRNKRERQSRLKNNSKTSSRLGVGDRFKDKSSNTNGTGIKGLLGKHLTRWSTNMIKENVVILKITFPTIEKHTINQVVTYGLGNLLGDIGGVLGLFLGASIFTVLEFADYFIRTIHENITNFRLKKMTPT